VGRACGNPSSSERGFAFQTFYFSREASGAAATPGVWGRAYA
jgi:hypothetical protein